MILTPFGERPDTRDARAGKAHVAGLFWAFGASLLALPFARQQDAPDWGATDHTRKLAYTDDEDESPLDKPFAMDVREFDAAVAEDPDWEVAGSLAELVERESAARYGRESERLASSGLVDLTRLAAGERVFLLECAGCHGSEGDGGGPAATHLVPRPRNLRRGLFKFASTPVGSRPLREDLFDTLTRGLVGSAMPSFRLLPEEKRWDVVEYVRWVAIRGEFEQVMLDIAWDDGELPDPDEVAEIVEHRWRRENQKVSYPSVAEPPFDEESVARGRELFRGSAGCSACHGDTGRGDGPSADEFRDGWGYRIYPRNLAGASFRVGDEPERLWSVIANGIGGTPMFGQAGAASPEGIWDLVHFVQHVAAGGEEAGR